MNKLALLAQCRTLVQARADTARAAMESAQAAANAEGKSSMGDKYETTRAMMQEERNRAAAQLDEALRMLAELDRLEAQTDVAHTKAQAGSLVQTNQGWFYITVAAGKIKLDGIDVFAISPQSPLAKLLIGKKAGDRYEHLGKTHSIVMVD